MNKEGISGNIIDYKVLKRILKFVGPFTGVFSAILFLTVLLAFLGPIRPYLVSIAIDEHIATYDYMGLVRIIMI